MKVLISEYNKRQDEYEVKGIYYDQNLECWMVNIYYEYDGARKTHCINREIGFYEWLINPKYKVFETLKIMTLLNITKSQGFQILIRQPEEIIKYLEQAIKDIK